MATGDLRNATGWFTVEQVATALQLDEKEFLRLWLESPAEELVYYSSGPVIHWFDLLPWAQEFHTKTSSVGADHYGVKGSVARGLSVEEAIESWKRDDAQEHTRALLEELLGLDDWSDGVSRRVATNWNLETGDYEVVSVDDL